MKKRVALCSKYFGYAVGGAEQSTLQMLLDLEAQGHQIVILRNRSPKHFGAGARKMKLPESWIIRDFSLPADFLRFRYLEYLLNRSALRRLANEVADADMLLSYGFEAPAVLAAFQGKKRYILRDEYGLGWMRNYEAGKARLAYGLYIALEFIPRLIWKRDFMASSLQREYGVDSVRVVLPDIDSKALKSQFESTLPQVGKRGVVFVGDNRLKGVDIAIRIARALPDQQFYFFARKKLTGLPENVTAMPWASPGAVYAHAEAVIVPSRWHEAYGRIVAEALSLGVPTIISDRGGLTEAGAGRARVISDLEDMPGWVSQIGNALNSK